MNKAIAALIVISILPVSFSIAFADLNDGMIAHYSFDGNANDDSEHNYHGIENGGVSYVRGLYSQGASFDGIDDKIELPYTVMNNLDDFTFSTWIYLYQGNSFANSIISGANDAIHNEFLIYYNVDYYPGHPTDNLALSFQEDGLQWTNQSFEFDTWYHVSVTRSAGRLNLYIDGDFVYTVDTGNTRSMIIDQNGLWLGAEQDIVGGGWDSNQQFNGIMDEVYIHNRVLSDSEIKLLAVVPEPISSILFVAGGLLLAGGSCFKRRKNKGFTP